MIDRSLHRKIWGQTIYAWLKWCIILLGVKLLVSAASIRRDGKQVMWKMVSFQINASVMDLNYSIWLSASWALVPFKCEIMESASLKYISYVRCYPGRTVTKPVQINEKYAKNKRFKEIHLYFLVFLCCTWIIHYSNIQHSAPHSLLIIQRMS